MRDWKMEHQKCKAGKCEKNKLGATCVVNVVTKMKHASKAMNCLLYTSPSPRDRQKSRMPSSA